MSLDATAFPSADCPGGYFFVTPGCGANHSAVCVAASGGACGGSFCDCDGKLFYDWCGGSTKKWASRVGSINPTCEGHDGSADGPASDGPAADRPADVPLD
jgi:hypothetical protein